MEPIEEDSATIINTCKMLNSSILKTLRDVEKNSINDATEIIKTTERIQHTLEKILHNYGDINEFYLPDISKIFKNIVDYQNNINQLQKKGTLIRFITQTRLRRKIDQQCMNICSMLEKIEKEIKEIMIKQVTIENKDEFNQLLEEIELMSIKEKSPTHLSKNDFLNLRTSLDKLAKVKDIETKEAVDNMLSIVENPIKRKELINQLPKLKLKPLANEKDFITIASDTNNPNESYYSDDTICAWTISTYPFDFQRNVRQGDPICDMYGMIKFENRIIVALADGCSWGEEPKEAARKASRMFLAYFRRQQHTIRDTHDVGLTILRAFSVAHKAIINGRTEENLFIAGTTTMLAGVLLELEKPEKGKNFIFICGSVGDCKAYHYSAFSCQFQEITRGNRNNMDCRDPGGRLGPTFEKGAPDLRNFQLYSCLCDEYDFISIVSDGVHDNLNPKMMGKTPKDINITVEDNLWDNVNDMVIISKFVEKEIIPKIINQPISVSSITHSLINHAKNLTKPLREFIENNPSQKVPIDYINYPGKLDHTTCVTFQIKTIKLNRNFKLQNKPNIYLMSSSDVEYENILNEVIEENQKYKIIWNNIFGKEDFMVEWQEFITKFGISDFSQEEIEQLKYILDNSNTGIVTLSKFEEFLKGFGPIENCSQNVKNVFSAEWFHGFINLNESKKFLEQQSPGTFLIRFSGSRPGAFVLDYVKEIGHVRSVRISNNPEGGFYAMTENNEKKIFKSLHELIYEYMNTGVLIKPFPSTLSKKNWFYGDVTSEEAEQLLKGHPYGTFLIRFSSHQPDCFAVSFVGSNEKILKGLITIHNSGGYQANGEGIVFNSIDSLVEYYIGQGIFTKPLIVNL